MTSEARAQRVDSDALSGQIRDKDTRVALTPERGVRFHIHGWRLLARMPGRDNATIGALPAATVESSSGPFSLTGVDPWCG